MKNLCTYSGMMKNLFSPHFSGAVQPWYLLRPQYIWPSSTIWDSTYQLRSLFAIQLIYSSAPLNSTSVTLQLSLLTIPLTLFISDSQWMVPLITRTHEIAYTEPLQQPSIAVAPDCTSVYYILFKCPAPLGLLLTTSAAFSGYWFYSFTIQAIRVPQTLWKLEHKVYATMYDYHHQISCA